MPTHHSPGPSTTGSLRDAALDCTCRRGAHAKTAGRAVRRNTTQEAKVHPPRGRIRTTLTSHKQLACNLQLGFLERETDRAGELFVLSTLTPLPLSHQLEIPPFRHSYWNVALNSVSFSHGSSAGPDQGPTDQSPPAGRAGRVWHLRPLHLLSYLLAARHGDTPWRARCGARGAMCGVQARGMLCRRYSRRFPRTVATQSSSGSSDMRSTRLRSEGGERM